MTQKRPPRAGDKAPSAPEFDPVPLRYRRDGCTPRRQVDFIRYLAACGCVVEACRRVGLSTESAYKLCRRSDAASFRHAWDGALAAARARRVRPLPSPTAQAPPCRPLRAIRPAVAAPARAAIMPADAAPARTSWQASTSSTSSTSAGARGGNEWHV
jgi:hypothetical protein